MRITAVRRISQVFFFLLFVWFCIVSSFGESFWQLSGWPVNWFLQLDPLVALGNLLTTGTLYSGLLWAFATIALTLVLGRFFCGWLCPFGSIHHFMSWLGFRSRSAKERIAANRHRGAQKIKYYILLILLSAALGSALVKAAASLDWNPLWVIGALAAAAIVAALLKSLSPRISRTAPVFLGLTVLWTVAASFLKLDGIVSASLQTGLLDPIPLVYRSANLVLLPFAESSLHATSADQRYYEGAGLIAAIFLAAVLLNLLIPRFYCRFVCPLGALFGVLGRFALWRVGKKEKACSECLLCDSRCEGACNPSGRIHIPECVLCMNCLNTCKHDLIGYHTFRSASGEISSPDLSRRGFVAASVSGMIAVPLLRIDGKLGHNWNYGLVRPPGSLPEAEFLNRCIKCGQCARVCPTNVIQLDTSSRSGIEGLWTPTLNFRAGSSGCQLNCTACSHICPTAAIRPLTLEEKLGRGAFDRAGPVRIGTAFVDRGRCLPWAMDKPCIVCQENCPVSPKAIFVKETFVTIRGGELGKAAISASKIELPTPVLQPERYGTGDFYLLLDGGAIKSRNRIQANTDRSITLDSDISAELDPASIKNIELQVRLQAPQVDPERCIGCGICEHECPVSGLRAIRVSGEGESRHKKHSLLLK